MNYGLYLSASGVLTNTYRQDVFANNLANAQTVGFKMDRPSVRQRAVASIEDPAGMQVSQALLDRLGGGAMAGTQRVQHDRAAFAQTHKPLDVALDEAKTFFAVRVTDQQGREQVQLTRDGRFSRNSQGYLVTMAGGHLVLDTQDQPIQLPQTGNITIQTDGSIYAGDHKVSQLQVTGVKDLTQLIKQGQNRFAWRGKKDLRQAASRVAVRQGFVEQSDVDPIQTLMQLVDATKAANGNANMIRYQDQMLNQVINTLGRVA